MHTHFQIWEGKVCIHICVCLQDPRDAYAELWDVYAAIGKNFLRQNVLPAGTVVGGAAPLLSLLGNGNFYHPRPPTAGWDGLCVTLIGWKIKQK